VLSFISLFPTYVTGFRLVEETSNTWSTVIHTVAMAVAGLLLLAPGTRRPVGPGFLLGSGATALFSVIVGITLDTSHYFGDPGAGLWFDVAGGAVAVLATVIVVVSVVGSGMVRLARRPAPYSWLAALAGVVGAVALYLGQQKAEWFEATPHLAGVTWTSVAAVVVPLAAAMTLPHRFAIALIAGWLVTGLDILAFNAMTGITVFAATLVALAVVLALLIRAERRAGTPA
jgi:hypothetical protein